MQFIASYLDGVFEILPNILQDERGCFFESYHQARFEANGIFANFVQDNQSFSHKGVLRGLHLQLPPHAQAKLVSVAQGSVLDVVVDLRKNSPTFGKYDTFHLDTQRHNRVFVPEGFAHGFLALEDCILTYKCTNFYHKAAESGIIWNDPTLAIDWQQPAPIVSEKDQLLPTLKQYMATHL
ncbi:MAG: dTDP-4-dehydrorhamnose 3,5-epimerase [Thermonemataceae bacterium]